MDNEMIVDEVCLEHNENDLVDRQEHSGFIFCDDSIVVIPIMNSVH